MSFELTSEEERQFLEETHSKETVTIAELFREVHMRNLQNGLLTDAEFDRITSGRQVWQQWQYK